MPKGQQAVRLDRFIANQTGMSRNDAKELLKKQLVTVNGKTEKLFDRKIDPEQDRVTANGKEISYRRFIYIMLNKPQGVVCAVKDRLSPAVTELVPPELRRKGLFPAGRLDKNTEGFVFITDDGEVCHRLISPTSHIEKQYYAELEQDGDDSYITRFNQGITIDGGEKCRPGKIEFLRDKRHVYITISEGKYHQVKRMIKALGNEVIYLKRVRIGGLMLDGELPLGKCREIGEDELKSIFD